MNRIVRHGLIHGALLFLTLITFSRPVLAREPLFPFVVSYDTPANLTNVADWLDRPAGRHGFVRVEEEQFVTDAGPIRFWGTNLCYAACFPSHDQAERLAARLARLGINCVRLHHMDSRDIWGKTPNGLALDPGQLERLDYLVAQLKWQGIYVNINLHVSRWFDNVDGSPPRAERPRFDKGLDNFEPRMIELQEKYAQDLLTHVNPYTGNAYTDEPAVAMVEINNENALLAVWSSNRLDDLSEPYATTYRQLWNRWLQKKYGTTKQVLKAWNVQQRPLGMEILKNGRFAKPPSTGWQMERDKQTQARWSVADDGPDGTRCLRIEVLRGGKVGWLPQITQRGLSLKRAEPYTLSFYIKADNTRRLRINCMMVHAPWKNLGLSVETKAGPSWRRVEFLFKATDNDQNGRITFTNLTPGIYELADVSLRSGGTIGPRKGETIESATIPVVRHGQSGVSDAIRRDFVDFLWDTEQTYWERMFRFLKDKLGVKSPIAGTQLGYSPPSIQARLAFLDTHAYFEHPYFPSGVWDMKHWTVGNVAMVNDPAKKLNLLASRRVIGKPLTVTEYNHPAPNEYAAEGFPMIAAFGAFQSWNGVFSFAYSHNTNFEPRQIQGFFDIKADTGKLVHMPACAAMFLRGDVAPARRLVGVNMSAEQEHELLYKTLKPRSLSATQLGLDPMAAFTNRVGIRLVKKTRPNRVLPTVAKDRRTFVSDTGQLCWNLSTEHGGTFTVDTPRTKLFTGFVRGRTFALGEVRLKIGKTRLDWATVSMTLIEGDRFDRPGRILVAATGLVRNYNARPARLENNRITLGNRWGSPPVLCEGIPADVMLPVSAERVRCFALDESGNRKPRQVEVVSRDGHACLLLAPSHKTVWYEVEIR